MPMNSFSSDISDCSSISIPYYGRDSEEEDKIGEDAMAEYERKDLSANRNYNRLPYGGLGKVEKVKI